MNKMQIRTEITRYRWLIHHTAYAHNGSRTHLLLPFRKTSKLYRMSIIEIFITLEVTNMELCLSQ